ncbi:HAD family hydrolase [Nakamurella antarctica]|uniref:HAD family hydrolase n=1 Tax=Nakamurella antarctica TaxID=1902245 RepID=A0A3G8ZLV3_9ACTN|nr:HAD family hydrolase [Nakamurella antarctica]AZI57757.1 HAD family hydrolase [Nakamurella antarctica]
MTMLGLLLDFDGTLYTGDLPIQAYARRVAGALEPDAGQRVIAGMRAFLEGAGEIPPVIAEADDGYSAVHLLARDAGLDETIRQDAYQLSRHDLARSAFALEPVAGMAEFLAEIKPRSRIVVLTNAPAAGVHEVLEAIGLRALVDEVLVSANKPAAMPGLIAKMLMQLGPNARPDQLLAVGDRWEADLSDTHHAGGATAYIDRYQRGDGTPTWRAQSLAELLPELCAWADFVPSP